MHAYADQIRVPPGAKISDSRLFSPILLKSSKILPAKKEAVPNRAQLEIYQRVAKQ
jgi:hypothetical protein